MSSSIVVLIGNALVVSTQLSPTMYCFSTLVPVALRGFLSNAESAARSGNLR